MENANTKVRLSIPHHLKSGLPHILDALNCLRLVESIEWISTSNDEQRFNPYFSDFDEEAQARIKRLATLYEVSPSQVVTTALSVRLIMPKLNDQPAGYNGKT